jgi:hypothetical protein
MITPTEKKQLKEIMHPHYTDAVLEILNNKAIRNRNGHPHTATYVMQVFNGFRSNKDIENAIWDFANQCKAEKQEQQELKQKVLN